MTATDLALTITQMLRKAKVVGKFVEFFGPGAAALPVVDRATIANMAPEYGATMGFFPIDAESRELFARDRPDRGTLPDCTKTITGRRGCSAFRKKGRSIIRRSWSWIWARSFQALPARNGRRIGSNCRA